MAAFLNGQIRLTDIADINEQALTNTQVPLLNDRADMEDILAIDKITRHHTDRLIKSLT